MVNSVSTLNLLILKLLVLVKIFYREEELGEVPLFFT